jgi:predicted AlkP superfamily pyrophosphatase or phosphodiesterase
MRVLFFISAALLTLSPLHAAPPKVVMISIDGLRGTLLSSLPERNLNTPNLNAIVKQGAVADGLIGVFPTVTYPSHTSLVTGVSPAVHGIVGNGLFDPEHKMNGAWYWYSEQIKVPTVWDSARKKGLHTAAVSWPVTVGAAIDANFPEDRPFRTYEDKMLFRAISTPGLLNEYEKAAGEFPFEHVDDHLRAQMAVFLLHTRKPDLLLVHFIDLDHQEHIYGPDSPQAMHTLEAIDDYVGMIQKQVAAEGLAQQTTFLIVSDHGFLAVDKAFHPDAMLNSLGLLGSDEHPNQWRVAAFTAGSSFGLVAHDPNDHEAIRLATSTLQNLLKDDCWGIGQIFDEAQLKSMKAYPNAFLAVSMKSDFAVGGGKSGPLGHAHL